jgi:hypothetical protein
MAGPDWILKGTLERALREVRVAHSMDSLLQEVARFVAEIPLADRASWPRGFVPRSIVTQQDIAHWAERMRQPEGQGAAFCAMRELLAVAAQRAQRLRPRRDPVKDGWRTGRSGGG